MTAQVTVTARTPALLAVAFAFKLREQLAPELMAQVIALNAAEANPDVCHSHDFCDANIAMEDAFKWLGLSPFNAEGELDGDMTALWNAAWDLAKASEFAVPQYLREFPDDGPDLGIAVPPSWEDRSWHNDDAPCFAFRASTAAPVVVAEFRLWVTRDECPCYHLSYHADARGGEGVDVLETNGAPDIAVAMALVELREEVRDWQDALGGERDGLDALCARIDALLEGSV